MNPFDFMTKDTTTTAELEKQIAELQRKLEKVRAEELSSGKLKETFKAFSEAAYDYLTQAAILENTDFLDDTTKEDFVFVTSMAEPYLRKMIFSELLSKGEASFKISGKKPSTSNTDTTTYPIKSDNLSEWLKKYASKN